MSNKTPTAFDKLKRKQKNKCAVCGKKLVEPCCVYYPNSQIVKAILCRDCNATIGICKCGNIVKQDDMVAVAGDRIVKCPKCI